MFKTLIVILGTLKPKLNKKTIAKGGITITTAIVVVVYSLYLYNSRNDLIELTTKLNSAVVSLEVSMAELEKKAKAEDIILIEREKRENSLRDDVVKMKNELKTDLAKMKVEYVDDEEAYNYVSSERVISGLWDQYCNGVSDGLHCPQ